MSVIHRPETPTQWLRLVGNLVNLSTPAGLLVARIGHAHVRRGPRGLFLAEGYSRRFPVASAFTVGSVLTTSGHWDDLAGSRPHLQQHEEGHTWQYLYCQGLPFFLPYGVAMAWSVLRTGDRAAQNFFERQAGLELGGYLEVPVRPLATVWADLRRGRSRSV